MHPKGLKLFGMKKVLLLGAGRSASVLIQYLLNEAASLDGIITVADQSLEVAQKKIGDHQRGHAIALDAASEEQRKNEISNHDIIISLLPPHLHISVAKNCLELRKNLITASYVTTEMQNINEAVKQAGLLFMCEMGLDPGIDHMSAMKIFDGIRSRSGKITSFKSATGGLVAPSSDDNPWHYKITWNPRNVVLAGHGTAQYLDKGIQKYLPYHNLFKTTETFKIDGYGKFESYPNRDSLSYIEKYGLTGIETILRSTLRRSGYCDAWNLLVQLGLTEDSYAVNDLKNKNYSQWLLSYLPSKQKWETRSIKERLAKFFALKKNSDEVKKLEWLGLFSDEKIPLDHGTPAEILQDLLVRKWQMRDTDRDLVVMRHEVEYMLNDKKQRHISTLAIEGEDSVNTAMAKTVGLPLGIMTKLMITHNLFLTGVHIPVMSQVFVPVLNELEKFGIKFQESSTESAETAAKISG